MIWLVTIEHGKSCDTISFAKLLKVSGFDFDSNLILTHPTSKSNLINLCYNLSPQRIMVIKGSIKPTHGSVCSGAKKLQSMNVLKWLSTKAE